MSERMDCMGKEEKEEAEKLLTNYKIETTTTN